MIWSAGCPAGRSGRRTCRALYGPGASINPLPPAACLRFLRFIERMQDSGADLGSARALGEQEDVVEHLSIHRAKGWSSRSCSSGLAESFEMNRILRQSFLLH